MKKKTKLSKEIWAACPNQTNLRNSYTTHKIIALILVGSGLESGEDRYLQKIMMALKHSKMFI